ncbi:MAG: hypothetical protein LUE98_20420 [Tannerellaceae bacterium]|nr:hypothetical protein [Tannerellaceae bacterium]MCD8179631.1 hypothetical protein [Tannerellaceae bacterium]
MKSANLQLKMATLLCVAGVFLLFCGMILPPMGELHPSVLIAFGEICTFAGGLFGVDYCYRFKMKDER